MEQVIEKTCFGKMVRDWRKEECMTVPRLAEMLHIDTDALYRYELGRTKPPLDVLQRLTKITGMTMEYLYRGNALFGEEAISKSFLKTLIPSYLEKEKTTANIIWKIREENHLTQIQMGELLSCSHSLVNKGEQGTHLSLSLILRYSECFCLPLDVFFP